MAEKKSSVGTFINEKILPSVMKFVNTKAVVALKDGIRLAVHHHWFYIPDLEIVPYSCGFNIL